MLGVGIIGLPNVGKSSLFNLLSKGTAQASNFPFTTIDPNVGVVAVPDERLDYLNDFFKSEKYVPSTIKFVDIAGLVKGASKGEGLGNQFLANIRIVDAIIHIVRLFENENVTHVSGKIDPINDIETINTELAISDLEQANKTLNKLAKEARSLDKEAIKKEALLKEAITLLDDNKPVRSSPKLVEELVELQFLTAKPIFYVANISENTSQDLLEKVQKYASAENSKVIPVRIKDEQEVNQLSGEEKTEYQNMLGIKESLTEVIQAGYDMLNLITFFTAGPKEAHAWPIQRGTLAPQAAGKIHTDFEKGFIRAQVYNVDDLKKYGDEKTIKEKGALRIEGKQYVMQDGNVVEFLFNV